MDGEIGVRYATVMDPRKFERDQGLYQKPWTLLNQHQEPISCMYLQSFHTVDGSEIRLTNQLRLAVYLKYSQGSIHPTWCRISSTNSIFTVSEPYLPKKHYSNGFNDAPPKTKCNSEWYTWVCNSSMQKEKVTQKIFSLKWCFFHGAFHPMGSQSVKKNHQVNKSK